MEAKYAVSCYDEEVDSFFLQEALKIKRSSCSEGNFATKLLQVVFQQSEFVGVTVQGQETRVVRPSESNKERLRLYKRWPCSTYILNRVN